MFKGGANNRLPPNIKNAVKRTVEKFQKIGRNYRGKDVYKNVPDVGLIVWVFWKGENKWYKGKVINDKASTGFTIQYDDEEFPVFHPYDTWEAYKWSYANLRQEQLHKASLAGNGHVKVNISIPAAPSTGS